MKNVLLIYRARVFNTELLPKLIEYKNDNVTLVLENSIVLNVAKLILQKYTQSVTLKTVNEFLDDNNEYFKNMKFDVIVGNPPYQEEVGPSKTEPIWHLFVEKCFNHLKSNGYLSLIHPNGWRNVDGRFKKVQKLLLSKDIQYLEMHSVQDGMKTFGASTAYDYYVLINREYSGSTHIKFDDGTDGEYDISNMEFIPNSNLDKIRLLVTDNGDETVEMMYSCDYHTQRDYMNKEKSSEYTYPCVYSVVGDGEPTFYYSNTNQKGHFGIPKLILGNGANPKCFIDYTGTYGMTQFAFGIIDDIENLEKIKKVLESNEFQKINLATKFVSTAGNPLVYPKIVSLFKKDFWKEFIDD
jgi:hypothetical protein